MVNMNIEQWQTEISNALTEAYDVSDQAVVEEVSNDLEILISRLVQRIEKMVDSQDSDMEKWK
tara:strand:- start:1835 stop:2023 length:189 start_codon:yes stop_codon:yes gene_type:complete